MDTIQKKMDTFNLYKHNNIYYFRIRIDYKLYRKSLKTSNLKKAIILAKLLKTIPPKELKTMFEVNVNGVKTMLEYESIEELEKIIEYAKYIASIQKRQKREDEEPNLLYDKKELQEKKGYKAICFQEIFDEFIANKKNIKTNISDSSLKQYTSVIKKLNLFFGRRDINEMTYKDFELFRQKLIEEDLNAKTINNIIYYTQNFINFAKKRFLIKDNVIEALDPLEEQESNRQNYTDEQIKDILRYVHQNCEEYMFLIFITAIYTGLRSNEIIDLKEIKIEQETNIRYFDIPKSKTDSGIRKVPLHPILQTLDYSPLFELNFNSKVDKNKIGKRVLRVLYEIVPKKQGWVFHSFRGTIIQKIMNIDPLSIPILMDMVGHSQEDKQKLTINTYGKGFSLSNKFNLISKLSY